MQRFKAVNDSPGHAACDPVPCECAAVVSTVMVAVAGGSATLGHLGGEELPVLLHGASLQAALDPGQAKHVGRYCVCS